MRRAILLAALAVGALAPAACGGSSGASAGSGDGPYRVTVAIPPVISGVDVYAAQEQGFFRRHGLAVTVKTLNGGAAIVPALASGAVDIGETNVVSAIQGGLRGIEEPCFTGANTDPKGRPYLSLVASPKAGVASAADLAGKTVAVNATSGVNELLVDAYLAANHVNPGSVKFVAVEYPDMPAAIAAGRVAAAMTSEPFTTITTGRGAKLLAASPLENVAGTPTYSCWNAASKWLGDNRQAAARWAAAMRDTNAWISAHPAAFRKLAAAHLKTPADVLARVNLPVFTDRLSRRDIDSWVATARRFKLIDAAPKPQSVFAPVGGGGR